MIYELMTVDYTSEFGRIYCLVYFNGEMYGTSHRVRSKYRNRYWCNKTNQHLKKIDKKIRGGRIWWRIDLKDNLVRNDDFCRKQYDFIRKTLLKHKLGAV